VNVWPQGAKGLHGVPARHTPAGRHLEILDNLEGGTTPPIDSVIAPDIYVADYVGYQEVCQSYRRRITLLLIPETGGTAAFARYMFYSSLAGFRRGWASRRLG